VDDDYLKVDFGILEFYLGDRKSTRITQYGVFSTWIKCRKIQENFVSSNTIPHLDKYHARNYHIQNTVVTTLFG